MLPRAHRMTTSRQFAEAISGGRRAGASTVVVYALAGRAGWNDSAGSGRPAGSDRTGSGRAESDDCAVTSVGFVVSKAVGNSVVRHRVLRQLRALIAQRMPTLEFQRSVVVRALPAAAGKPSSVLAADLDRALGKALRPPAGGRS